MESCVVSSTIAEKAALDFSCGEGGHINDISDSPSLIQDIYHYYPK